MHYTMYNEKWINMSDWNRGRKRRRQWERNKHAHKSYFINKYEYIRFVFMLVSISTRHAQAVSVSLSFSLFRNPSQIYLDIRGKSPEKFPNHRLLIERNWREEKELIADEIDGASFAHTNIIINIIVITIVAVLVFGDRRACVRNRMWTEWILFVFLCSLCLPLLYRPVGEWVSECLWAVLVLFRGWQSKYALLSGFICVHNNLYCFSC